MWFRRLSLITILTTYLLILAGGIVRSTGSGMGCPDWPRCFGTWVPPTDASQLPPNYAELFGAKLKGEVVFNAAKTWTEYVNRLLGVVTGLLIFATLLASISYLKKDRAVFWLSVAAFVLVGFQGWLGSKVVSTELKPVLVTLHMVVAIVIVFVLLYALARAYAGTLRIENVENQRRINQLLIFTLGLSVLQVVLGTQVREMVDEAARALGYAARTQWVDALGVPFYIHRSFSLVVLGLQVWLVVELRKFSIQSGLLARFAHLALVLIGVEIGTGAAMAYFAIPAYLQPIHLTLAIVILGAQFMALLLLNAPVVFNRVSTPLRSPQFS
jgi:cytochrome c oxidase assembly protein subunit 15